MHIYMCTCTYLLCTCTYIITEKHNYMGYLNPPSVTVNACSHAPTIAMQFEGLLVIKFN